MGVETAGWLRPHHRIADTFSFMARPGLLSGLIQLQRELEQRRNLVREWPNLVMDFGFRLAETAYRAAGKRGTAISKD